MGLVGVACAKGAPGVTTLSVALAALTPGAVLADLDPAGGDVSLRYRRADGAALDPRVGVLSLAASRRGSADAGAPGGADLSPHLQDVDGGLPVLAGVSGPDQAAGVGALWPAIGRVLAGQARTAYADLGRIDATTLTTSAWAQADVLLLLARAELEGLAHLRELLRILTDRLRRDGAVTPLPGVVLVAAERDRAAGSRTAQLLRAGGLDVPVLPSVSDDPRGAAALRGLRGGGAGRSTLVRSVRSLIPDVARMVERASVTRDPDRYEDRYQDRHRRRDQDTRPDRDTAADATPAAVPERP